MSDPNAKLMMQQIHTKCGDAIARATAGTAIPPEFLAALIANESGGDSNAKRFESNVLLDLWAVLAGRKAAFGSIGAADLAGFLTNSVSLLGGAGGALRSAVQQLDGLATSWGLTQIMGYNALGRGVLPASLADPGTNLRIAVAMLREFVKRFSLPQDDLTEALFRCWNTGHPSGVTADPNYVHNGLARIQLYAAAEPAPIAGAAS